MATYATKQDLLDRDSSMLWNLAIDRSTDDLNDTAIDRALELAADEINSFLKKRYVLPLLEVPGLLREKAIDVAFYWLAGSDQQATNMMTERYQAALKTMKDIANGERDLGLPTLSTQAEGAVGKVELVQGNERLFTRKTLGGIL